MAGVGLIKLVQSVLSDSETLSLYLILMGFAFGIFIWFMELRTIMSLSESAGWKSINFYIYASTILIYLLSLPGILEVIYLFSGDVRIRLNQLISWQGAVIFLPYLGAWMSTVDIMKSRYNNGTD
jgi:hypothetical protein